MECKEQQRRLDICAPEGGNMGVTRNLGVNTSNKEAGIYIDLKINDVPAKFLVDTAATISLVSNEIFYALDKSKRSEVRPLRQTIVTANRTNLSSIGQSLFNPRWEISSVGLKP